MNTKFSGVAMASAVAVSFFAAVAADKKSSEGAVYAPNEVRIMIASFGTIESQTKVEKWLGEQIQDAKKSSEAKVSKSDLAVSPGLQREIVQFNWQKRRAEIVRESQAVDQINAENQQMLRALQMKVLSEEESRYIPVAKDYLQAAISRKARNLIKIVDRGNIDAGFSEQELWNDGKSKKMEVAGATCILSATYGDFETDTTEVKLNSKGTTITRVTYTQPYQFKVRDLKGNVLMADSGAAELHGQGNNVVNGSSAAPNRKLVEKVCEEIADKLIAFYTSDLKFSVKVPTGMDEDDVTITVDGKDADLDGKRVLAFSHRVTAHLDGCEPIEKDILIEYGESEKTVRFKLRKVAKKDVESKADSKGEKE